MQATVNARTRKHPHTNKRAPQTGTQDGTDMSDESICGPKCWTTVKCPEHYREMTPIGRSWPDWLYPCCENYMRPELNSRHLWDRHDDARHYVDPDGWADHYAQCVDCNPALEDDE